MVFVRKRTRNLKEKHSGSASNETISKRLLKAEEAAQYLGLKIDTVYKKSRMREIPSVKVGRALRFDVKALDRYIEQNTITVIG